MNPLVRAKGGDRWVARLPTVIAELVDRWGITVGEQLDGGTSSYVARAHTAAGEPAVVKISVPDVDFRRQIQTLTAAQGRGYVRVFAAAPDLGAVLLEPLGGSLAASGLPPIDQLAVVAALLPVVWQVPDLGGGSPFDKAADLAHFIESHRSARYTRIIDQAMRCAERRSAAFNPEACVVVHGDAAAANVLARPGQGWVFVDPDGFLGDPAYDRGVAARDWCDEILESANPPSLLQSYCQVLGGDPDVTREWAFIERVSTGLYIQSLGGEAKAHLTSAQVLLA